MGDRWCEAGPISDVYIFFYSFPFAVSVSFLPFFLTPSVPLFSSPSLYSSLSPFLPYTSAGVKKFLISFDDGDEIWTGLPAKDVRLAVSDLATAGGVARDGVSVHVVSYSGQNCALA